MASEYEDSNAALFTFKTHEAKGEKKNIHTHESGSERSERSLKYRIPSCFREEGGNVHLWYLSLALKDGEKSKDFKRKNRNSMETGSQRPTESTSFLGLSSHINKS